MVTKAKFPVEGGCTCRFVRFRMMTKPLDVPIRKGYYEREKFWPEAAPSADEAVTAVALYR